MSTTSVNANRDREASAGLTCNERLWPCAGRGPWPSGTGFESRLSIGGATTGVDFVRSTARQGWMGPSLVVPIENRRQLVSQGSAPKRNAGQRLQDLLGGENHALHDGMLPCLPIAPKRGRMS